MHCLHVRAGILHNISNVIWLILFDIHRSYLESQADDFGAKDIVDHETKALASGDTDLLPAPPDTDSIPEHNAQLIQQGWCMLNQALTLFIVV